MGAWKKGYKEEALITGATTSEGVSVGIQSPHKRQGTVPWDVTELLQARGRGMASSG